MTATHYETLGVTCDARPDVIKAAYRELIKRYHPDRIGHHGLALTQAVNAAYHVLRDHDRRAAYDLQLERDARRARAEQEEARRSAEQPPPPPEPDPEEATPEPDQEAPRGSSSRAGGQWGAEHRSTARPAGLFPAGAVAAPVVGAFAGHVAGAVMLQTVAVARGVVDYVLSLGALTGVVSFALSIGIGFICWFIGALCTERSFAGEAVRFRTEVLLFPSCIILAFGRFMLFPGAFWPQLGFVAGVYLGSRAVWRYPAPA